MKLISTLTKIGILLIGVSCQSIRENHYFKDRAGNPPNYYRLQIKGHAFLTSSRYLSGKFDEEAVNNYFGEITQPKSSKIEAPKAQQPSAGGIVPIDGKDEGKKFVMLLSTNSDAISSAFGNFVESKETQKEIARIVNKDKLDELTKLEAEDKVVTNKRNKLLALAESYLNSISAIESKDLIEGKLLAYLNATADYFNKTQNFKSIEEAKKWFELNSNNITNP